MKISKPVLLNSALGVVIVGAIVGGVLALNPVQASTSDDATQLTSTVQQGAVSSSITASGQIAAASEVSAYFDSTGTIASVRVSLGETVKKGQVLGTLETDDLSDAVSDAASDYSDAASAVSSANSAIATAKKHATSTVAQTKQNAAQELSSATSQLSQAQDQLDQASDAVADAKEALAGATLKAPISGLVIAVTGTVGSSTSTGGESTGFATIADVSELTMTAAIAEADIADVEVGQTADVTFPALEDTTATATVTAIAPTATASNSVVTYATTITLDDIPDGLRLGQTAEVSITTVTSADDALYVPTAAITTATDGTSTVDVVGDDGETTTVTVTLGVVGDQGTEILTGLEAGQTVVLGEVVATDSTSEESTQQGGMGGFGGGGTPPTGGGFPGGN